MELRELQQNWNQFGEADPFWAILTDPRCKDNRWDPVAFFHTGEKEIDSVLSGLAAMGLEIPRHRALDFGCGVGRLTQALCRCFERCDGVDIAPSMITLARKFDKYPGRCHYHLNETDSLALFQDNTFDFIYSRIVLQHMRPQFSRKYVGEFVRVLASGGVLIFQIPAEPRDIRTQINAMPDAGFRASLTALNPPSSVAAGAQHAVTVRVRNISSTTWPSGERRGDGRELVLLGNHWLSADGTVHIHDDGRAVLPLDLKPSESVDVELRINAPMSAGTYILELDLVQEGVSWFKHRGSETLKTQVAVTAGTDARPARKPPVMEMYGVPKSDVVKVIETAGGYPFCILDDASAGGWVGYTYIVTKPSARSTSILVSTVKGDSPLSTERVVTAPNEFKRSVSQLLPTDLAASFGPAVSQLAQAMVENATLQARATEAIAARVMAIERLGQSGGAEAHARSSNGNSDAPNELIKTISLLASVSDATASHLLALEDTVRETNELVRRLGEGTPAGGRFAVYQGNNTALTRVLNRFKMYVDTTDLSLSPHLIMEGHWEPWITKLFTELVRPGITVVDIGANFGYFTILAGIGVGPTGKVYAFEADPRNFEILRLNLEVNGLLQIVEAHQRAVLHTEGSMELRRNPTLLGCHSLFAGKSDSTRNVSVETVRLDDVIQGSVDVMKIDAEGSEPFIFEGMRNILERSPNVTIFMEFNVPVLKLAGVEPSNFLRTILDHGFRVSILAREGNQEPLDEHKVIEGPISDLLLTRP